MKLQLFSARAGHQATADDFRDMFLKHHQPLYYFAFDLLQNASKAEDAVASAFLHCWKNMTDGSRVVSPPALIEENLYASALDYCYRHLGQLYRGRVLSGIFNRQLTREEFELRVIESKVIQQLA